MVLTIDEKKRKKYNNYTSKNDKYYSKNYDLIRRKVKFSLNK